MKIKSLGHVVIRVADVGRAGEQFYNGVLGLPVCARLDQGAFKMAFFSLGNHHDFAVMQRPAGVVPEGETLVEMLDHVAFKIGETLDELREAKAMLDAAGIKMAQPIDHEGDEVALHVRSGWQRRRTLRPTPPTPGSHRSPAGRPDRRAAAVGLTKPGHRRRRAAMAMRSHLGRQYAHLPSLGRRLQDSRNP